MDTNYQFIREELQVHNKPDLLDLTQRIFSDNIIDNESANIFWVHIISYITQAFFDELCLSKNNLFKHKHTCNNEEIVDVLNLIKGYKFTSIPLWKFIIIKYLKYIKINQNDLVCEHLSNINYVNIILDNILTGRNISNDDVVILSLCAILGTSLELSGNSRNINLCNSTGYSTFCVKRIKDMFLIRILPDINPLLTKSINLFLSKPINKLKANLDLLYPKCTYSCIYPMSREELDDMVESIITYNYVEDIYSIEVCNDLFDHIIIKYGLPVHNLREFNVNSVLCSNLNSTKDVSKLLHYFYIHYSIVDNRYIDILSQADPIIKKYNKYIPNNSLDRWKMFTLTDISNINNQRNKTIMITSIISAIISILDRRYEILSSSTDDNVNYYKRNSLEEIV